MSLFKCSLVLPLVLLLGIVKTEPAKGQDAAGTQESTVTAHPPDPTLVELIRKTQNLAEQSQAELKRSREQNELLQRLLEQTRQELSQIRLQLSRLRGDSTPVLPAAPAVASTGIQAEPVAQQPVENTSASESKSDLENRVSRLEDRADIASAQLIEHAQTKIESDSRFKVRLFGTLLSNTYFNTSDISDAASPTAAPLPSASPGGAGGNLGATFRQTTFGFAMTGPKIGQDRLSADVDFDFFGGASRNYGGAVLGTLRMRTATIRLDGSRTSIIAGLTAPLVSPLNPTSLASTYYPALAESGNLWQWRPQFVLEHSVPVSDEDEVVLQGGVLMPFGERLNGTAIQGRPGYESRAAFVRKSDPERRLEIGAGVYVQPQRFILGRSMNSYAVTSDWVIPLTARFELSGEAYYGRGNNLGEQSGEDLAEAFAISGPLDNPLTVVRGIHSLGGWTQLRAKASSRLDFNFAFGIDDKRNRDNFSAVVPASSQLKNRTLMANSIFRLTSNLLVSVEYRRLWTTYPDAQSTNNHINLALGYLF